MQKPSAASSTIRASVRNILYKMKNYSFILIAFIAVMMTACKKTSHITGTIEDGKDRDTLFLISDVKNGIPMDTLFVKGGRFEYETEPDRLTCASCDTVKRSRRFSWNPATSRSV